MTKTIETITTITITDDYDHSTIDTEGTYYQFTATAGEVIIRKITNNIEVAAIKATEFDFKDKNNAKHFIDDLGT